MIQWDFTKRIGQAIITDKLGRKHEYNIYQGNAYMIMLWENEEKYELVTFWADEQHAKNCLGLSNKYKESIYTWEDIYFYLDGNYEHSYKLAQLLRKAKIHHTIDF